jgi:cytochrome c oxidase subunit 2
MVLFFKFHDALQSFCHFCVHPVPDQSSYENSDFTKLEFDSYMIQQEDQQINTFRLLDTGNRVVLPINSPIPITVTAADVLHSWTVPRLGVKTDAKPGRLNQVRLSINRPRLLYGQCSDICGTNYRFMSIVTARCNTRTKYRDLG